METGDIMKCNNSKLIRAQRDDDFVSTVAFVL
jgi:hypothetical protein